MLVYTVKIFSTLLHLVLIFSMSSISVTSLGMYSFYVAIISIISQICMFEGAQHAIAKKIKLHNFYEYYFCNCALWCLSILLISFLIKDDALVLIFTSIFMLNLTCEKLINILTIKKRINLDDHGYVRLFNLKNIIFEIAIPLIFILNIDKFQDTFNFSILFISLSILLNFCIILFALKNKVKPSLMGVNFFSGIVFKKIDGLFIRLFTGYFWGFASLGAIQPAMSVARVISILLPLWINLNLNSFFRSSVNHLTLRSFIWIPLSYFVYLVLSFIAWNLLQIFYVNDYSQLIFALAFIWFGNANTKAIIRGISVFNGFLQYNNNSLIISLLFKLLLSFLIPTGHFLELFVLLIMVDFTQIAITTYMLLTKGSRNIESK
jgi:hypothetical protein